MILAGNIGKKESPVTDVIKNNKRSRRRSVWKDPELILIRSPLDLVSSHLSGNVEEEVCIHGTRVTLGVEI